MTDDQDRFDTPPRWRLGQDWTLGFFRARALLVLIVFAGVLGMALFQAERDRSSGRELILASAPIDPRDVFFGHYATLRYRVQGRNLGALIDETLKDEIDDRPPSVSDRIYYPLVGKDPLYVAFEKRGRFHEPVRVSRNRASLPANALVLKAFGRANRGTTTDTTTQNAYSLRIAIDLPRRYYADRETALAIEEKAREAGRVRAEQRRFERCERERERAASNPQAVVSKSCETVTVPPNLDALDSFGVILSVPPGRDPVIRGLLIEDRRIIDQLTGPKLMLSRQG
ncbi:MAG: GDYXXLXY domain-containing protein [Pseudomonadota bacterium]